MNWERRWRRRLGGGRAVAAGGIFCGQTAAFGRARLLVGIYYAALLYFALALLPDWPGLLDHNAPAALWPVAWLRWVDLRAGIALILTLNLAGALAAAALPERRWARVLAFCGLFEYDAFNNSYGKIGHSLHLWVLTAALLIFLPRLEESPSRVLRQRFLTVFWACQAMVMLVYSMSGLGKLAGAAWQIWRGGANAFMPGALAATVANRLVETNSRSLLGPWLINHPLAGWPLMPVDIYLQTFAFCAVFRPTLQRAWALALILFHIAVFLLMTISFAPNALLLALLFINSPFRSNRDNWRTMAADLPLFGRLWKTFFPARCAS